MHKESVLVIEDDKDIAGLVERQLRDLGFEVEWTGDGEDGLNKARASNYALIVLDLQLPGLGGVELCRRLREEKYTTPVLMLTGKVELVDKVLGLEVGADEYITKPFHLIEFSARVKSLLRRSQVREVAASQMAGEPLPVLHFQDLHINDISRTVELGSNRLDLTKTEYDLLSLLVANPGRVFTREDLLRSLWGTDAPTYEDNITTHVSRLRSKLEVVPKYGDCIVTVRGLGYRFLTIDEFRALS